MTTLYTTTTYKNIEMDDEQVPIVQMLIERYINQEKETIQFFYEKLNGAGSTQDVRDWTDAIQSGKSQIKKLNNILLQLLTNEKITKHTF